MAEYSNLCQALESGDFGGNRVVLIRFPKPAGDSLYFQPNVGVLGDPVLAASVDIDADTSRITFAIHDPHDSSRDGTFEGEISNDVLIIKGLDGSPEEAFLPRVTDFNREIGNC